MTQSFTRRLLRSISVVGGILLTTLLYEPGNQVTRQAQGATIAETSPGNLEERTGVQHSGAFFNSIPIDVPQGIRKANPHLKLTYSSQADNGILGQGWRLAGLPTITRTKRIIAIDGVSGTIDYSQNDRFAFQGKRLINISGTYGADGTVYRTEIETWNKITSNGQAGSGPESFTVVGKHGHIMEFGHTTDSRALAMGRTDVRVWHLNQVTDRNGNVMTVTYTQKPLGTGSYEGRVYPLEIAYTSNTTENAKANRYVRFQYEARPDVVKHYQGGAAFSESVRLTNIQTYVAADIVSDYRITYGASPSPTTGRSRVASIQRFDSTDGDAVGLSPATFTWQDGGIESGGAYLGAFEPASSWSTVFTKANGWDGVQYPYTLADVNGDGILDVVGFKQGTQVALGTTSDFQAPTQWINEFSAVNGWTQDMRRRLADVNSDGLADVVGFNNQGIVVSLSTGSAFAPTQSFNGFGIKDGWNPGGTTIFLTDVNGDQQADIVGFYENVQVALSGPVDSKGTWAGFQGATTWNDGFGSPQGWSSTTPRLLADINGDGLADVVGFKGQTMSAALSDGTSSFDSGGFSQSLTVPTDWDTIPRMVSDTNGDGLTDILAFSANGVQVSLSSGTGFQPFEVWNTGFGSATGWSGKPIMMADVNGDGLSDIVGVDSLSVKVATSTGQAFVTSTWNQNSLAGLGLTQGGTSEETNRMMVDVNGDGLSDMIGFGELWVKTGLSSGENPDRMIGFTKSTGAVGTIEYAPLSDSSVYSSASPSALAHFQNYPPLLQSPDMPNYRSHANLGGFYYVTKSYTVKDNPAINDNPFTYSYSRTYSNAVLNLQGRGWMGFEQVTSINDDVGRISVRIYNQEWPLTGQLASTTLSAQPNTDPSLPAGGVVSAHYLTYTPVTTATGVDVNPTTQAKQVVVESRKTATRNDHYYEGTYVSSLGKSFSYDSFGNITVAVKMGLVSKVDPQPSAAAVYTLSQYVNDEQNWRLGFLQYRKVTPTNDLSQITSFQDGDLSLDKRTYDANMNMTSEAKWDNTNNFYLTHSYGYDAFGNRTTITLPSGAVYTTDYETTYNTYPQTKTSPTDHTGNHVVWHYGYDPRFGLLSVRIRPNGQPQVTCYDTYGRRAAVQGPAPDAQTTVKFDTPCYSPLTTIAANLAPKDVATLTQTAYQWEDEVPIRQRTSVTEWPATAQPSTVWEKHYADGLGRNYKIVRQDPENTEKVMRLVQINSMQKIVKSAMPYYSGDTPVYGTFVYDTQARLLQSSTPSGPDGTQTAVATHAYQATASGEIVTQVDAQTEPYAYSKVENYAYAANRRVLQKLTIPSDQNAVTLFESDLIGRLTKITPPLATANQVYTYTYDSLGRLTEKIDPSRGTFSYTYSKSGYLHTRTQADDTTVTFEYDNLGRTLSRTYTDNSSIQYGYDAGSNGQGKMTSVAMLDAQTPQSSYAFEYDAYQRKQQITLTIDGQTTPYVTGKSYDPLGRLVALANPDQSSVKRQFNMDRLSEVELNGAAYATFSNYSALGLPQTTNYQNEAVAARQYSPTGVINRITVTDASSSTLFDHETTWNHLGELTDIQDMSSGTATPVRSLTYSSQRLTQTQEGDAGAKSTFGYDQQGNLTSTNDTTYSYTGNQVIKGVQGETTVYDGGYDNKGNLTSLTRDGDTWQFGFNSRNRMISAKKQGEDTGSRYLYDHVGRRIAKYEPDGTTTIYVSFWYQEFQKGNNTLKNRMLFGPDGVFVQSTTGQDIPGSSGIPTQASSPLFLHGDYQFSVVLTTDSTGKAATRFQYQPYGSVTADGPDNVLFKYTGKERDSHTGFYYFNARYYDPISTRFTRADTTFGGKLSQGDATNAYAFMLNTPPSGFDPNGHSAAKVGCAGTVLALVETGHDIATKKRDVYNITGASGLSIAAGATCYEAFLKRKPAPKGPPPDLDSSSPPPVESNGAGSPALQLQISNNENPLLDKNVDSEADLSDDSEDIPRDPSPNTDNELPVDHDVPDTDPVNDAPPNASIDADPDGGGSGSLDGMNAAGQPASSNSALSPSVDSISNNAETDARLVQSASREVVPIASSTSNVVADSTYVYSASEVAGTHAAMVETITAAAAESTPEVTNSAADIATAILAFAAVAVPEAPKPLPIE